MCYLVKEGVGLVSAFYIMKVEMGEMNTILPSQRRIGNVVGNNVKIQAAINYELTDSELFWMDP